MSRRLNRRQFVSTTAAAAGAIAAGVSAPAVVRAAGDGSWGDLTGRFVYDGTAPERKKLKVDKDVDCCGKFDIRDESLMVGPDGGLANVYVYVRSRHVKICPELEKSAPKRVTLDNKDCIFQPHCMWIWYDKQEFTIVNSDPIAQSVAFSPFGDRPASIVMKAKTGKAVSDATYTFGRQQNVPVPIACVYHPWESAYILPRGNPCVAITGADGRFTIPKLPVGELEFQAWHERVGYLATGRWKKGRFEMAIEPAGSDLGTITLEPGLFEKK